MTANSIQIGGAHYASSYQHWDFVQDADLDYFSGQVTKYVARWRHKNGVQDLRKAAHFAHKLAEVLNGPRPYVHHPGRKRLSLRVASACTFAQVNKLDAFETDVMVVCAGNFVAADLEDLATRIEDAAYAAEGAAPGPGYVSQS